MIDICVIEICNFSQGVFLSKLPFLIALLYSYRAKL